MNARQKRFAEEYSVDHVGAQAAIRAGYSARTAKQTASRMMKNVAVKQLVAKLDAEKRDELGIERTAVLELVDEMLAEARVLVPKMWKGAPVVYTDPETGEERVAVEFVAAALAGRLAELKVRLAGLLEARSTADAFSGVVFKLSLDRDLSEEGE